jgi:hypothetical protein
MRTVCDEWVEDQKKKTTTHIQYFANDLGPFESKEMAEKFGKKFIKDSYWPKAALRIVKVTTITTEVS